MILILIIYRERVNDCRLQLLAVYPCRIYNFQHEKAVLQQSCRLQAKRHIKLQIWRQNLQVGSYKWTNSYRNLKKLLIMMFYRIIIRKQQKILNMSCFSKQIISIIFCRFVDPYPKSCRIYNFQKLCPPPLYSMEAGAAIMHTILIYITKYYNM